MAKGRIILTFDRPELDEDALYALLSEHVCNMTADFSPTDSEVDVEFGQTTNEGEDEWDSTSST